MFGFKKKSDQIESLRSDLEEAKSQLEQIKNSTIVSSQGAEMNELFGAPVSYSGKTVNSKTAMKSSAVYASVRIIAGAISTMSLPVYEDRGDEVRKRASELLAQTMLNKQPNQMMTASVFWDMVMNYVLLKGDSFAPIIRTRGGDPVELLPWNSDDVVVEKKENRLKYFFRKDDGEYFGLDQDDVLHIPGVGFDGKRSLSPIKNAGLQTIGLALAAEEYSSRFFSNGARPDMAITFPEGVAPTDEQQEQLRKYWYKRHQGVSNSHLPAVLTNGGKIEKITMTMEDAQLIESRKFQVIDIARIFGIPPHMIGETEKSTSWGTGLEQLGIGFVTYTLRPYMTKIEQEINRKLFRKSKYYAEFNPESLIRGDSKAESEYFRQALGGSQGPGWMTVNEIRKLKNLEQLEGDQFNTPFDQRNANETVTQVNN